LSKTIFISYPLARVNLNPKRRQIIDQPYPSLFKEHTLLELSLSKFGTFFSEGFGRPTKELHTFQTVLQQIHDLTGEETVVQLKWGEDPGRTAPSLRAK